MKFLRKTFSGQGGEGTGDEEEHATDGEKKKTPKLADTSFTISQKKNFFH